jgi:hypothetical protein
MIINYLVSGNTREPVLLLVVKEEEEVAKKMKREKKKRKQSFVKETQTQHSLWTSVDVMKLEKFLFFHFFFSSALNVQFSMSNVPSHRMP